MNLQTKLGLAVLMCSVIVQLSSAIDLGSCFGGVEYGNEQFKKVNKWLTKNVKSLVLEDNLKAARAHIGSVSDPLEKAAWQQLIELEGIDNENFRCTQASIMMVRAMAFYVGFEFGTGPRNRVQRVVRDVAFRHREFCIFDYETMVENDIIQTNVVDSYKRLSKIIPTANALTHIEVDVDMLHRPKIDYYLKYEQAIASMEESKLAVALREAVQGAGEKSDRKAGLDFIDANLFVKTILEDCKRFMPAVHSSLALIELDSRTSVIPFYYMSGTYYSRASDIYYMCKGLAKHNSDKLVDAMASASLRTEEA